jgi:hypothetical protein
MRNMTPILSDLLARVTPETLAAIYQDVTDIDDIFSDDLAGAVFDELAGRIGHDEASRRLDLVV